MAIEQFTGILAAVVTPLSADGSAIDEAGIRRQTDHILGNGIHGLVPGGSTGEFTTLTIAERKRSAELLHRGRGRSRSGRGRYRSIEYRRHRRPQQACQRGRCRRGDGGSAVL